MIDMNVFRGFLQAIQQLPQMARPLKLTDAQRVVRAKEVMRAKMDRGLALDLEACVRCGYCSEACHFFQATGDPKYAPPRKLDLLRRFHARETSAFELYKSGIEQIVANAARFHGLLYGLTTVGFGLAVGWLATVVFRRD